MTLNKNPQASAACQCCPLMQLVVEVAIGFWFPQHTNAAHQWNICLLEGRNATIGLLTLHSDSATPPMIYFVL